MKVNLPATALCAFLMTLPAVSQDQPRSTTPTRAETDPTSDPPADPHRAGGRPEAHGGTVHAPQVDKGASMPADMKPVIESIALTAITAQQYGNLASKRHTSGAVHDLGDRMVVTNSRINRALTTLSPDVGNLRIPAKERGTFDNLARDADEVQFGVSVAQWVAQSYPPMIDALEKLGKHSQFQEMVQPAVPELKSQLSEAQRILKTGASANGAPTAGRVTDPKKRSD